MTPRPRISAFQLMTIAGMLGVGAGAAPAILERRGERPVFGSSAPSKPTPPPEHIQKRLDAAAEKRHRRAERNLRNADRRSP